MTSLTLGILLSSWGNSSAPTVYRLKVAGGALLVVSVGPDSVARVDGPTISSPSFFFVEPQYFAVFLVLLGLRSHLLEYDLLILDLLDSVLDYFLELLLLFLLHHRLQLLYFLSST
jgi:hypothetical protein